MQNEFYVTEERLKELKDELGKLKTEKRIEVAKRLKRAKELGDLSENSEYIEAREEQEQVERRIYDLEQMVKNASIITKSKHASGSVEIGSTIEVERDGKVLSLTIVGSSETKPEQGFISNESPLGKAFLGRNAGETVSVKTPNGEARYRIRSIS
jgi:transcription elongation factor GreA